jgi:exopolyphosphatase/guanosine-5'-triphosphate,3'-diphosphate pyrophosphatase
MAGWNFLRETLLRISSTAKSSAPKKAGKITGLRYWMARVLEECDRVSSGFGADPVHDLRVALRRCRSMADGLIALDPDPEWKAMKKAGRALFRSLGDLRDVQVMMEWIERLHPRAMPKQTENHVESKESNLQTKESDDSDPVARALHEILASRESEHKQQAKSALDDFDRKQWRQWSKSLPLRAARFRPESLLFKHLALERWTDARKLHDQALRNRSQVALHTLRIGIKRFRYIVENFLPAEHKLWSRDLKEIQDLLGEVHDLDVLWSTAVSCHVFPDDAAKNSWRATILEERSKRVERYRARMVGPDSWWQVWRAALPQGKQIQQVAMRRMKLWARALDPDFAHSERVAGLALELHDGLSEAGLIKAEGEEARSILLIAALLHDVGKAKGHKGHHKASLRLITEHAAPLGWNAETLQRAAVVARFHHGALPSKSHKALRDLLPDRQKTIMQLAAILRLANALDAAHDGHVRRVQVEQESGDHGGRTRSGCVMISAEGYSLRSATARTVAAERYLLETVLHQPVLVRPINPPGNGSSGKLRRRRV